MGSPLQPTWDLTIHLLIPFEIDQTHCSQIWFVLACYISREMFLHSYKECFVSLRNERREEEEGGGGQESIDNKNK